MGGGRGGCWRMEGLQGQHLVAVSQLVHGVEDFSKSTAPAFHRRCSPPAPQIPPQIPHLERPLTPPTPKPPRPLPPLP